MAFPAKDMAEVTVAVSTANFGPKPVLIGDLPYCAGKMVVKGWPTAAGIKFSFGVKERIITLAANIGAILKKTVIFTSERELGSLLVDNF